MFCRYCITNTIKHSEHFFITDEQDEYQKLVLDTFNIQIYYRNSADKVICIKCAKAIKNAAKLKKEIIDVQKTLSEDIGNLTSLNSTPLKAEIKSDDEEFPQDSAGDSEERVIDDDNMVCSNEIDNDDLDTNTSKSEINILKCANTSKSEINIVKCDFDGNNCDDGKSNDDDDSIDNSMKIKDGPNKPSLTIVRGSRWTNTESLKRIIHNSRSLVTNSNMCLFLSQRTKFKCYICRELFVDIRILRDHSLTHGAKRLTKLNRNRGLSCLNVDISNLSCAICSDSCNDLEDLRIHLLNRHDIPFQGTEHNLVPYKLEELRCVICHKDFTSFCALSIHMHTHSTKNICEICGTAFVNWRNLKNHLRQRHKEMKCTKCSVILPSMAARKKHLKIAHNAKRSIAHRCNQCDLTFEQWYKVIEHQVEKHGRKPVPKSVCKFCCKEFNNLQTHIRAVHIKERNYPCSLCSLSFFTSADRKRHERTHSSDTPFTCDWCDAKFRSKDSMRRHLKFKHGELVKSVREKSSA